MRHWALLVLAAVVLTPACKLAKSPPESRAVIDAYFEKVKHGSLKEALPLYAPEFFAATTPEEYVRLVDRAHAKLGALKSYTINPVTVVNNMATSNGGIYTTFECEVEFEKYKAVESFRVFQPKGSPEAVILQHNINSPGLVLE